MSSRPAGAPHRTPQAVGYPEFREEEPGVCWPPEQPRRAAQPETESHNQTHDNQKEAKKFNIVEFITVWKCEGKPGRIANLHILLQNGAVRLLRRGNKQKSQTRLASRRERGEEVGFKLYDFYELFADAYKPKT